MNFESERNHKDFYSQQARENVQRRLRDDLRNQQEIHPQFKNYSQFPNAQLDSFPKYNPSELDFMKKQLGNMSEVVPPRGSGFDMNSPVVIAGKEHLFSQPPMSRDGPRGETERDRRLRLRAEERARKMNGDSSSAYTQSSKPDLASNFNPSFTPPKSSNDLYQNIDPEKLQMYRMEAQRQFEEQKAKMIEEAIRMRSQGSSDLLPRLDPPPIQQIIPTELYNETPIVKTPQQQSNGEDIKKLNYRMELQRQIDEKKQRSEDERKRGYISDQREDLRSRADYGSPNTAVLPGERYDSAPFTNSGSSNTVDKKLQYRLELERQIQENKQRKEEVTKGRPSSDIQHYSGSTDSSIPDRPNSSYPKQSSLQQPSSEETDKKQIYKLELERQIQEKKKRLEEERRSFKGIEREVPIEYYDEEKPVINQRVDYNRPTVQTPAVDGYTNIKPPKISNPYQATLEEVEKKNAYRLELQQQIEEQKRRKDDEKLKFRGREDIEDHRFRNEIPNEKPIIRKKHDPNRPSSENPNIDRYQELANKKPPTQGEDYSDLINQRKDLFLEEPLDLINMPLPKTSAKNMAFNQPASQPSPEYKPRSFYNPPVDSEYLPANLPGSNYGSVPNYPTIPNTSGGAPSDDLKFLYENYVRELQILREQAKEEIQRDKEKLLNEMMQQYRGGMTPMHMQSIPMQMNPMQMQAMGMAGMPMQQMIYPMPLAVPNNMYWNPNMYTAQSPNLGYGGNPTGQESLTEDLNLGRNYSLPEPAYDMFPPTKPFPATNKKDLFGPGSDINLDPINETPELINQPILSQSQEELPNNHNYKLRHSYIKNLEELERFNPEASLYNTHKWVDLNHHFGSIQVPNQQSLLDIESSQPEDSSISQQVSAKPRKTWDNPPSLGNPPSMFLSPKDPNLLLDMKSSESWGESLPSDAFHIAYQGYSPNPYATPAKESHPPIQENIEEEINSEEDEDEEQYTDRTYETKRVDMTMPKYSDSVHSSIDIKSTPISTQQDEENLISPTKPLSRASVRQQSIGNLKPFVIKGKEIATVIQDSPYRLPSESMSSQEGYHYNESFLASGGWKTGADSSWGASKLERAFPSYSPLQFRNESGKEFLEPQERDQTVDSDISRHEYQDQYSILPPTLPSFLNRIPTHKQLSIEPLLDYQTLEPPPVIFPDSLERQESRTGSRSSARHSKPRILDVFKERRTIESSETRIRSPSRKQSSNQADQSPNRNKLQEARDRLKQVKDRSPNDEMEKLLADIIQKPVLYSKPSSSESQRLKADDKPFMGKFSKIAQNEFRLQKAIQGVNEAIKSSEMFPMVRSDSLSSIDAPLSILRPISSAKSSRRYDNIGDVL